MSYNFHYTKYILIFDLNSWLKVSDFSYSYIADSFIKKFNCLNSSIKGLIVILRHSTSNSNYYFKKLLKINWLLSLSSDIQCITIFSFYLPSHISSYSCKIFCFNFFKYLSNISKLFSKIIIKALWTVNFSENPIAFGVKYSFLIYFVVNYFTIS